MLSTLSPFIFALLLASDAHASQGPELRTQGSKHPYASPIGFTLGGGVTGGIGIGVRKHFENRWGFHATGIPVLGRDSVFGALGIQGMYSFYRGRVARMYGLAGIQGIYTSDSYPNSYPNGGSRTTNRTLHSTIGAGIGLEIHFNHRISWSLELPVAAIISSSLKASGRGSESSFQVLPIPNSALTLYY